MTPEKKDELEKALFKEIGQKISRILEKKKKEKEWKHFIRRGFSQLTPAAKGNLEKQIEGGLLKELYPGEFEEFLNSGEMQITLLLARLKALEAAVLELRPEAAGQLNILQKDLTEEVIAREWLAYKSGRLSSSDFYDLLENED